MTVVTVPDLSYKDQNTAEKLLKQAGLTPEYIGEDYSDEYPEGQVFYQSVSSGTQVEKGTTVQYMEMCIRDRCLHTLGQKGSEDLESKSRG